MRLRLILSAMIAACIATLFAVPASALDVPAAPALATPIVDQTKTLTTEQIEQLSAQIARSRQEKSYQIGILLIPTLGSSEYLEGYSIKVARTWGIGDKDSDNGVLILVVKDDRQMRIEVGRGLEGDLTDLRAGRIVRDVMKPKFQQNDFYGGLSGAINSIQLAVSQKADPSINESDTEGDWDVITFVLGAIAFVLVWLGSVLGRTKSWWLGGVIGAIAGVVVVMVFAWAWWTFIAAFLATGAGLLFDFLVSRNYRTNAAHGHDPSWWAGGGWLGGGGFSGGGGGSFGGGGFSGGGSSGSW